MDREPAPAVSPREASRQLEQLRSDQRWAKLTGGAPAGYDVLLGGCLTVHLVYVGLLVGLSNGELSLARGVDGGLLLLAVVNLVLPVSGRIAFHRGETGSWRGTAETRPSALGLLAAAVSYAAGLASVGLTAAQGRWVPMGVCAALAGIAWVVLCRRWMVRYRAEVGYPGSARLYATYPLFVLCVIASNLVMLYGLSVLGRLVPGL